MYGVLKKKYFNKKKTKKSAQNKKILGKLDEHWHILKKVFLTEIY